MVLKASAPGNDKAKTEKCRCRGKRSTDKGGKQSVIFQTKCKGHPVSKDF